MIVYPAIDLKDGQCVRLLRGAMDAATVFNDDPAGQARAWQDAGFGYLHIVDLNGAVEGRPVNEEAVRAILGAIAIPAQLGGGIRTLAQVETWLDAGLARVILGTVALQDPALVKAACTRFPGRVVVGIDARGGMVATHGWVETSGTSAVELAGAFEDAGVAAIVYTDIDRDGTLGGPNVEATAELARAVSTPVIASGGVSSADDIRALAASDAPIAGVIVGRALYDGRVSPAEALAAARG